ncbi:CRISPR system precrRNA processing endoribonuclease RAMP protein Cas6 [Vibrio sp. WXL210]|uniref:CRISPR system precrRNA processing endoribonuclease RAMP protein Cas6 n=1 Tax=Vibrio sp. WXL210 TaxID=3450709 RepID=UPI003EC65C6D
MLDALIPIAESFSLLKLQLTLKLDAPTRLPAFKGAMWHGLLGHALRAYDAQAYHVLFGAHHQQQPKPYALAPDGDHKIEWGQGELLSCELSLFGDACQLANVVVAALQQAGDHPEIGIGERRVSYQLLCVGSLQPLGLTPGIRVTYLADWLSMPRQAAEQEVALHLLTPVRIKHQNRIITNTAPELEFWLNHTLRRLTQLSRYWAIDNAGLFDALYTQVYSVVRSPVDTQSHCYFEDWQRYSARHEKTLPLGGLKGLVSFYGDLAPVIDVLKVGELLQLGGKTTFGLGKYQLIASI